jgi:hypothetical protein
VFLEEGKIVKNYIKQIIIDISIAILEILKLIFVKRECQLLFSGTLQKCSSYL